MSLSSIPNEPHWAIIEETRVTIPGDERSRTNPGHGYPEHTETFISYIAYRNEPDWLRAIESLTRRGMGFRAIKATVANVKVNVSVE